MLRILPGILLFLVLLAWLSFWAARRTMENIYLELATARAATIASAARQDVPGAWARFTDGGLAPDDEDWEAVDRAMRRANADARIARLKVYSPRARLIYGPEPDKVGRPEDNPVLAAVLAEAAPGLMETSEPDGSVLYELYVPLMGNAGQVVAVFELYEPTAWLDAIVQRNALVAAAVPGALLLLLVAALTRLVRRAQRDIDRRTDELVSLRKRLETFLSDTAVGAARQAGQGRDIPSRRIHCAVLYTDVRDFTGYSEHNDPADVVAFLDRLFAVQIQAVLAHGGDVDKFVGDALLAWFEGDDAPARALSAARDMLESMPPGLPRGIGSGVYTGQVISGAVGPADRRDFTIIGDSVNMAARLCSAAAAGQVVADAATVDAAGEAGRGFGEPEEIRVKGRGAPLLVRRLAVG